MFDADGSADPGEIPAFVEALVDGADVAKGSRFRSGGGSDDITALRRWGNAGLDAVANLLFRTSYTDLCYGYNAFWADVLPVLDLPAVETPDTGGPAGPGRRVRDRDHPQLPGRRSRTEDHRGRLRGTGPHPRRDEPADLRGRDEGAADPGGRVPAVPVVPASGVRAGRMTPVMPASCGSRPRRIRTGSLRSHEIGPRANDGHPCGSRRRRQETGAISQAAR
ncbi:hypothetical protein ACLFMI_23995 [Pseudonocardia nantongensis]|uniref:hypothetical protein n=1 Tax=Pseudonocardia nantongensis TaxID=1181885 RepID=UPI00397AE2B0